MVRIMTSCRKCVNYVGEQPDTPTAGLPWHLWQPDAPVADLFRYPVRQYQHSD